MKAVGVKILKAKLSEYLRLVKSGETVLVTERDEVIAELRPSRRQEAPLESWDDILDRLAERGQVTRRSDATRGWPSAHPLSMPLPLDSRQVLDELRKDKT